MMNQSSRVILFLITYWFAQLGYRDVHAIRCYKCTYARKEPVALGPEGCADPFRTDKRITEISCSGVCGVVTYTEAGTTTWVRGCYTTCEDTEHASGHIRCCDDKDLCNGTSRLEPPAVGRVLLLSLLAAFWKMFLI